MRSIKLFSISILATGILISSFWITKIIPLRRERNILKENLSNANKARVAEWEKDSLSLVKKAIKIDSLNGVLLSSSRIIIKQKNTISKLEAIQEEKDDRMKVKFMRVTKCDSLVGYTLTDPPEAFLSLTNKPVILIWELTTLEDEIIGRVKPSNECLEIVNAEFRVPSDYYREKRVGFSYRDFLIGGLTGLAIKALF